MTSEPIQTPGRTAPIGIFDSGIGGLSVVAELLKLLPHEDFIYFGDTARVPYGTKSERAIISFSRQISAFLLQRGVKIIVVACNSASAAAVPILQNELPAPVFGVIEPGAAAAVKHTQNQKVGIIGTTATINSRAYPTTLERLGARVQTFSKACPLFVPLVEEGLVDHAITRSVARHYLEEVKQAGVDTVILGCTHYPLLEPVIRETLGKQVHLVNSAAETARFVERELAGRELTNPSLSTGNRRYYLSDPSPNFQRLGSLFLNDFIDHVQVVDLAPAGTQK